MDAHLRPLAEDLTRRDGLPPTAAGLLGMARGEWQQVRSDPGAVLLLVRLPASLHEPLPHLVRSAEVLASALDHLHRHGESSLIDWSDPRRGVVRDFAVACARTAYRLAEQAGRCDPERARVAGLLAPLGWLAVAAHSPSETTLLDRSPEELRTRWGLDADELTRRLARRWRLPAWLRTVIGHLGLPADLAEQFGADPVLFGVTQQAVRLVQRHYGAPRLRLRVSSVESLSSCGTDEEPAAEMRREAPGLTLTEHLAVVAARRRVGAERAADRLEAELDLLHRTLEEQRGREEDKLRTMKLESLAEFAAGAGHEINNPLAVISGQAQYLLGREEEPARRTALEKIIGQTQRIHSLLRDLMQFSRPTAPTPRPVDLVRLIDESATSLEPLAHEYQVRIVVRESEEGRPPVAPPPCIVRVDEKQVRTALTCLMKNAVEAAGAFGWVRVRLEVVTGQVHVIVEDSGTDLSAARRPHLFDPFYSGSSAGRGTGLGLPTAWSLARQQGGDVTLASEPGEPTRFVMRLPYAVDQENALAG